jgi:hypothetical protein
MATQNAYYQQYLPTILWNLSTHLLTFFWLIHLPPCWILPGSIVYGEGTSSREARLCRIFDAAEKITNSPNILGRTINSLIHRAWRSIEVKGAHVGCEAVTAVVMKNKASKEPAWKQALLGLFLDLRDEGDLFLRIVVISHKIELLKAHSSNICRFNEYSMKRKCTASQ